MLSSVLFFPRRCVLVEREMAASCPFRASFVLFYVCWCVVFFFFFFLHIVDCPVFPRHCVLVEKEMAVSCLFHVFFFLLLNVMD